MGGHGLYSTVGDYMRFIRMWLNDGAGPHGRVLKPETVKMAEKNHLGDLKVTALPGVIKSLSNDAEFFPGLSKSWAFTFMVNDEQGAHGTASRRAGLGWPGEPVLLDRPSEWFRRVLGNPDPALCRCGIIHRIHAFRNGLLRCAEPTQGRLASASDAPQSAFDHALSAVRSEAAQTCTKVGLLVAVLHGWLQDRTFKLRFQHKLWDRSARQGRERVGSDARGRFRESRYRT